MELRRRYPNGDVVLGYMPKPKKRTTYSTQYGVKRFPNPQDCDGFCTRFETTLDADSPYDYPSGSRCWDCASAEENGDCRYFYLSTGDNWKKLSEID